jgi:hypothetical protein
MSDYTDPPDIGVRPPTFSDDAIALAFSDRHAGPLLYVPGWGCWLRWNGFKWDGRVLSRSSPSTPSCMKRSCQRHTAV